MKDVHRLSRLGVRLEDSPNGVLMVHNNYYSSCVVEVKSKQHLDKSLMELKVLGKIKEAFSFEGDHILRYQGRLCVPKVP